MDALKAFNKSLRARGETQCTIAAKTKVGRSHLTRVFSGRRCGSETRAKVAPSLTTSELWLLGWTDEGLAEMQWPQWELEYWRALYYAAPAGLLRSLYLKQAKSAQERLRLADVVRRAKCRHPGGTDEI